MLIDILFFSLRYMLSIPLNNPAGLAPAQTFNNDNSRTCPKVKERQALYHA